VIGAVSTGTTPTRVVFLSQAPWEGAELDLVPHEELGAYYAAGRAQRAYVVEPSGPALGGLVQPWMAWLPRSPEELLVDHDPGAAVVEAVRDVVRLLNPHRLVLGSLTTSVTRGGLRVARQVSLADWRVRITTGDAATVAVLLSLVDDLLGDDLRAPVAVVGLGIVGAGLVRGLLERGQRQVIVVGRDLGRLELGVAALHGLGADRLVATTDRGRLREAHVVIPVTSHPDAILHPDDLEDGTVVLDPAIPPGISAHPGWSRHVAYTGVAQLRVGDFGTPGRRWGSVADDECYACLSEGVMLAALDALSPPDALRDHHVGPVDPDLVRRFELWRTCVVRWPHTVTRSFGVELPLAAARDAVRARLLVAP
jgi:Shikimate / quinate 5-dehydrogenase